MAERKRPSVPASGVLIPLDAEQALRALSEFRRSEEQAGGWARIAPVEPMPPR
jgi:hypothetical protein